MKDVDALAGKLVAWVAALLIVGCAPLSTPSAARAPATGASFDQRLRALSVDPLIQRAAGYHLYVGSTGRATSLTDAAASEHQQPGSVQAVLAANVDDVVIVDWLVSFSAMGAWTADNPSNHEDVSIPVSDASTLVSAPPDHLVVYRMRDKQHLMLVRAVVVQNVAIGAVGFILAQSYQDAALSAAAIPMQ